MCEANQENRKLRRQDYNSMFINIPSTPIVDKRIPTKVNSRLVMSPLRDVRYKFDSRGNSNNSNVKDVKLQSNIYLPEHISQAKVRQLSMQEQMELFREGDKLKYKNVVSKTQNNTRRKNIPSIINTDRLKKIPMRKRPEEIYYKQAFQRLNESPGPNVQ
jgi:hypothetical protein